MKTLLQFRGFLSNKISAFFVFLFILLSSISLMGQSEAWYKVGEPGFSNTNTNLASTVGPDGTIYVVSQASGYSYFEVYKFNGSHWESMGAVDVSNSPSDFSIQVASDGTIYVSVIKTGAEWVGLNVYKYSSSTWTNTGSFNTPWDGRNAELILGSDGYPFFFYKSNEYTIRVDKYNGSTWSQVGSFSDGYPYNESFALASDNTPYVFYRVSNGSAYVGKIVKYNGSAWVNVGSALSPERVSDAQTDIDLNSTNVPYIFFKDNNNSNKGTVMQFNGSSWVVVGSAGFTSGSSDYNCLKFVGDVPYVFYKDGGNSSKASVMKYNGSSWENVGSPGFSAGTIDNMYGGFTFPNAVTVPLAVYKDNNAGGKKSVMKYSLRNITVTSPNGGEFWKPNTYQSITWTSSNVNNVKIEYTTNNGTSWTTVVASTPAAAGTYSWITPNVESEQCRVKVSDVDNPSLVIYSDGSDAVFTLTNYIVVNVGTGTSTGSNLPINTYFGYNYSQQIYTKEQIGISQKIKKILFTVDGSANNSTTWDVYMGHTTKTSFSSNTDWVPVASMTKVFEGEVVFPSSQGYLTVTLPTVFDYNQTDNLVIAVHEKKPSWDNQRNWGTFTSGSNTGIYYRDDGSNPNPNSPPTATGRTSGINRIAVFSENTTPSLIVTSPNGGENWVVGTNRNITWGYNIVENIKIEYTTNNGSDWNTIIASTPATAGSYAWTIPNEISTNCKVRISDASNASLNDESDAVFSIIAPYVTVTAPNGGETWQIGTAHNITWSSEGFTNVKIEYTTNNGSDWIEIIASTAASAGTYSWTIPNTPSANCKVRISNAAGGSPTDESNAVFTIPPPSITVTAPNGGESWNIGTAHNITWTYVGVTNVKLEYTTNNGSDWIEIIASTAASAGTYSWTIPNTPSANCKVRISNAAGGSPTDESNAVFTIPPPSITITEPNGGEIYGTNSTQNITWTSIGVSNVKIEYSTNNGSGWIVISASTTASLGTFSWTVPNTPSTNCLVKISDVGGTPSDQSNSTFTITTGMISVKTPNGGESWAATTKNSITWTHINVDNIKIEYSTNNGTNWSEIIASTPAAAGSYQWTVPNTPSSSCKVRLSDVSSPTLISTSRRVFTITEAPPAPAHIGGWALEFDGTNDYVNFTTSPPYTNTSITIEAWINSTSVADEKNIVSWGNNAGTNNLQFRMQGGKLQFGIDANGYWHSVQGNTNINTGKWVYVALVKNGNNISLYVNGKLEASGSTSQTPTVNRFLIGAFVYNGTVQTNSCFAGRIDEVRIWNAARTEAQIKANMYRQLTGGESGLVSYYKMTNGSGTTLTDNKGSNHGTLQNGPLWKASGCFAGPRQALDFDGSNDYINVADANSLDLTDSYTLECWMNATSFISLGGLISKYQSSGANGYFLRLSNTGSFNDLHFDELTTTGLNLQTGIWYHITAVKSGATRKLYVNGIEVALTGTPLNVLANNNAIRIGSDFSSRYFYGMIDEVRIWNTARTAAQIQENMMSTLTGSETGLVLYLRNDYYDGTISYDLSPNANNGTLTNFTAPACWVASTPYNTWMGGTDGSWTTVSNWSLGTVPSLTNNVGIFYWSEGGNECNIGSNPTINNLIISATANPSLGSNLTVNGNLLLQRDINLSGRIITLGSSANLYEGSNRFWGNTGTITTTRTLSNITNQNVGGLGFEITTSANLGNTTITRGHAIQAAGDAQSIGRYYNVSPTNNTGLNATVRYYYNESELGDIEETDLRLFKSTDNGTTWTNMGGTVNADNNTVTLSGVTGFSMWTLGDNNSPLPVELKSFSAKVEKQSVILKWQTETETDNYGFEIERSVVCDLGSDFEKIGFVKGNGNSNSPKEYSFSDKIFKSVKVIYRLKQIDTDGTFSYSQEIEVEISIPIEFKLYQNYPNPFNPKTTLSFTLQEAGLTTLKIYNALGEEVITLIDNEYLETGEYHKREFDARRFSSGMYIARLQSGNKIQINKMMLLK